MVTELHEKQRKKNYMVLAAIFGYMLIMFVITILRLSSAV